MPDVISFDEAIEKTNGEDRSLLIGNGFSAEYFSYNTLLDKAGLANGTPLKNLFASLNTADFEAVVRALEGAAIVERAYGNSAHAAELSQHAQDVREALVKAVNATHPAHRDELDLKYESSATFLSNFGSVFSLNYDLLLYWVNLHNGTLRDGFGLGTAIDSGRFRGPFREDAYCELFNLHGGLHLFQDENGDVIKAQDTGDGVISTITRKISNGKQLPLYVAEGSSSAKLRRINSVPYLRFCLEKLRANTASIFIYGHSADDNDAHIYNAIFGSRIKHVYFGIYKPNDGKIKVIDGILSKYQKIGGEDIGYTLYDAESAQVWTRA